MSCIVIFTFVLFLSLLVVLLYLCFCIWRPCRQPPETTILVKPNSIRTLLDPPDTDLEVLLRRRAIPNRRLIRAFGIHRSTFTNASVDVRHVFRRNTIVLLRNVDSPETWQMIGGVIKDAVDFYLPIYPLSEDYPTYMQAVVFVTVLATFFDITVTFPEPSDVCFVTEGINQLWTASKSPTFSPASPILAQINHFLHTWLPNNPADPFHERPLEIILPAYETLWRFVAHTFAYVEGSPSLTCPLLDFFDNPTAIQFAMPGVSEGPSAQHILQEVLRLHPPTKRIKRSRDDSSIPAWIRRRLFEAAGFNCSSAFNNTVAADIEALQRSSVWGPSPHDFDAMRHTASTEAQKKSFMPFGHGPLKCVASSLAPRLAGMVVAGVASRDDLDFIRGKSQGGREGWGGWKIRRRI